MFKWKISNKARVCGRPLEPLNNQTVSASRNHPSASSVGSPASGGVGDRSRNVKGGVSQEINGGQCSGEEHSRSSGCQVREFDNKTMTAQSNKLVPPHCIISHPTPPDIPSTLDQSIPPHVTYPAFTQATTSSASRCRQSPIYSQLPCHNRSSPCEGIAVNPPAHLQNHRQPHSSPHHQQAAQLHVLHPPLHSMQPHIQPQPSPNHQLLAQPQDLQQSLHTPHSQVQPQPPPYVPPPTHLVPSNSLLSSVPLVECLQPRDDDQVSEDGTVSSSMLAKCDVATNTCANISKLGSISSAVVPASMPALSQNSTGNVFISQSDVDGVSSNVSDSGREGSDHNTSMFYRTTSSYSNAAICGHFTCSVSVPGSEHGSGVNSEDGSVQVRGRQDHDTVNTEKLPVGDGDDSYLVNGVNGSVGISGPGNDGGVTGTRCPDTTEETGCTDDSTGTKTNTTSTSWLHWTQQLEAYVAWVNSQLRKRDTCSLITDLRRDLASGVVLADLIEIMSGETIVGIHRLPESVQMKRDNVERILQFMAAKRIRMHAVGSREVVEGSIKAIMRLILALAAHYKPQSVRTASYECSNETGVNNPSSNSSTPSKSGHQQTASARETSWSRKSTSADPPRQRLTLSTSTGSSATPTTPNLSTPGNRKSIGHLLESSLLSSSSAATPAPLRRFPSISGHQWSQQWSATSPKSSLNSSLSSAVTVDPVTNLPTGVEIGSDGCSSSSSPDHQQSCRLNGVEDKEDPGNELYRDRKVQRRQWSAPGPPLYENLHRSSSFVGGHCGSATTRSSRPATRRQQEPKQQQQSNQRKSGRSEWHDCRAIYDVPRTGTPRIDVANKLTLSTAVSANNADRLSDLPPPYDESCVDQISTEVSSNTQQNHRHSISTTPTKNGRSQSQTRSTSSNLEDHRQRTTTDQVTGTNECVQEDAEANPSLCGPAALQFWRSLASKQEYTGSHCASSPTNDTKSNSMSRGSYRRLLPKIPPSCKISHIAALNVLNTSHSQTTAAGSTTVTADELERRSLGSRGEVEGSSSHGSPSTSIVHSPAEESDLVITGQRAEEAVAEWLRGTPHRRSDSWACTSVKQDGVGVGGGRRDVLGVGQATSKPSDLWRNSALRRSTQLEHWAGRYHPVANNNNNNMSGVLTSPGGDCGDSSGDIDSIPISLPDPNSNLRLSPGGGRPRSGISPGGESARGSVATVQPDLSNNGGVQPPASYSNLLHELVTAKRQVVLLQQLLKNISGRSPGNSVGANHKQTFDDSKLHQDWSGNRTDSRALYNREEVGILRETLKSLRANMKESDTGHNSLDTLEQCVSLIVQRLAELERVHVTEKHTQKRANNLLDYQGTTKVIYYTEKTTTPYMSSINKRLGEITLRDFKTVFDRAGSYRFHFKSMDPEFGMVKEEVCDDDAVLPGFDGKLIAWVQEEHTV